MVLAELDAPAKGSPFGLTAEDEREPDWRAPLAARTLRYWPWPYGQQSKDVGLDVTAPASAEGIAALEAEQLERTRLQYVGATRARDYLAFGVTGRAHAWLRAASIPPQASVRDICQTDLQDDCRRRGRNAAS